MEEAGSGLPLRALPFGGDDAQLRHFQSLQLDLDRRDLAPERLVLDQRLAVDLFERGEFLQAPQPRLGNADAGDAGALVAEQKLGVIPALVLLAHQVLGRHADVVEKDFVDFMPAVDGLDRPHRYARRLHVDQQE